MNYTLFVRNLFYITIYVLSVIGCTTQTNNPQNPPLNRREVPEKSQKNDTRSSQVVEPTRQEKYTKSDRIPVKKQRNTRLTGKKISHADAPHPDNTPHPDVFSCEEIIIPESSVVYFSGGKADSNFIKFINKVKEKNVNTNNKFYKSITVKFFEHNKDTITIIYGNEFVSKDIWKTMFEEKGIRTRWIDKLKNRKVLSVDIKEIAKKEHASLVCGN